MRTTYVGMDIHKNFIQAAAMDEQGNIFREQKFKSTRDGIKQFVNSLDTQRIHAAIEATCTWYHVYETLNSLNIDTTLVNVRRTKVIAESKIKTDPSDAKKHRALLTNRIHRYCIYPTKTDHGTTKHPQTSHVTSKRTHTLQK